MCSIEEPLLLKEETEIGNKNCAKCRDLLAVVVTRGTPYCRECFLSVLQHRFRLTFGRAKVLVPDERVLIAYSGGPSSLALVHMSWMAIQDDQKRKMRIHPIICHVNESILLGDYDLDTIRSNVSSYDLEYVEVGLGEAYDQEDSGTSLIEIFKSTTSFSSKEDLVSIFRLKALIKTAQKQRCTKLFFGDSATRLAIKVIALTSKGRTSMLATEMLFENQRDDGTMILKPLKEMSSSEISFFNKCYNMPEAFSGPEIRIGPKESIDRLSENFILDLQKDYPSTIDTVARTTEKLSFSHDRPMQEHCWICETRRDTELSDWGSDSRSCAELKTSENPKMKDCSNRRLCYGCSVMMRDVSIDKFWGMEIGSNGR